MKMKRFHLRKNYTVEVLEYVLFSEAIVSKHCKCSIELSKVLNGANMAGYKEIIQVIKYVLDTRDLGLCIEPIQISEQPWELICFSDIDYAGDLDSRRSVSGFVLCVCGVPINWRSKAQCSVELSSSEAEWVAASEAMKEVVFVLQLLQSMKIKIKLPKIVHVDNVGAIFTTKNITTT